MTLSKLTVGLGLVFSAAQVYGLLKPTAFSAAARKFPRSEMWGYVLMALGTLWFLKNLQAESISDFANYKPYMLAAFGLVGLLTCIYVKDFLAVRGLAVVLLLLAKYTLDIARWHDSPWRVVMSAWAYCWIITGLWFTISPWRLRDFINWATANERRIRIGSSCRLAFGLFIVLLGLFAF